MPSPVPAARARARDIGVPKVDGTARRRAKTGQHFREFGLAVSFDAGNPDDLPFADVEADTAKRRQAPIVLGGQSANLQDWLAGRRYVLGDAEDNVAPHHEPSQLLLVGCRRFHLAHKLAAAHDRNLVGNPQHLLQLVRDKHHGAALVGEMAQDVEELFDLGRDEYRTRFVENQDLGTAIERLENLDPLHRADRQVANPRVEHDVEAVSGAQIADRAGGSGAIDDAEPPRCVAQHDVLEHGQGRRQHEMLMHHADAQGDGVVRRPYRDRLIPNSNLARVGLIQAVEHVHERTLARTVLADHGMNFAASKADCDIVVGEHAAETLHDAQQLDRHFHGRVRGRGCVAGSGRHRATFRCASGPLK